MDKLYFFSKSKDCAPGKGKNEVVLDPSKYKTLPYNFRKILSNFHVAPFKFEGYTYNTIEHVFQAKKIGLVDEELAYQFTMESKSDIGLGDGSIAQKNRKLVHLNDEQLGAWSVLKEEVMKSAAYEKYKQNEDSLKILLSTGEAELWHIQLRKRAVEFRHLYHIRSDLA
jgi:ribA/ribD-fused uncharacterized protein